MKYYTGIGSRNTPHNIINVMVGLARKLANEGYILRSGGSPGADTAFEIGAMDIDVEMEIFLPYTGFQDYEEKEYNYVPSNFSNYGKAVELAKKYHPNFEKLSKESKKFIVRDVYQVLGKDLNTISEFVVCWTKDGCIHDNERTEETGGTGQAISVASDYNIPVFNLNLNSHRKRIENWVD